MSKQKSAKQRLRRCKALKALGYFFDALIRLKASPPQNYPLHSASEYSYTINNMGSVNVSSDIDTFLRSANASTGRTNIGDRSNMPVVTITNAAVAMATNTRYVGSIASFSADRIYTLPAGSAGDVVEVQLLAGNNSFELILQGATGVSINGGSAATEWSRLFIDNEFVRFRCVATNDWRVEHDGRIAQMCDMYLNSHISNYYPNGALTKIPVDTKTEDRGNIGSTSTYTFTPRRAGRYDLWALATSNGNSVTALGMIGFVVNSITTITAAYRNDVGTNGPYNIFSASRSVRVAADTQIYAVFFNGNGSALEARGIDTTYANEIRTSLALVERF